MIKDLHKGLLKEAQAQLEIAARDEDWQEVEKIGNIIIITAQAAQKMIQK